MAKHVALVRILHNGLLLEKGDFCPSEHADQLLTQGLVALVLEAVKATAPPAPEAAEAPKAKPKAK